MDKDGAFGKAISAHLALAERNKRLERTMPLDRYREQVGGSADLPPSPPKDELPTASSASLARHWRDPDSWWDASEERSMPLLDWGEG